MPYNRPRGGFVLRERRRLVHVAQIGPVKNAPKTPVRMCESDEIASYVSVLKRERRRSPVVGEGVLTLPLAGTARNGGGVRYRRQPTFSQAATQGRAGTPAPTSTPRRKAAARPVTGRHTIIQPARRRLALSAGTARPPAAYWGHHLMPLYKTSMLRKGKLQ